MNRIALAATVALLAAALPVRADEPAAPEDEWEYVAPSAAQPEPAPARANDDAQATEDALVGLVLRTPAWQIRPLVASDPRFARLDDAARLRVLETAREDRAAVGFALNLLLGMGVGSFVQGDGRGGALILAGEVGSVALLMAGVANELDGDGRGGPLLAAGVVGLVTTKVFSLVRPFQFHGARYHALEEALFSAPAVSFFVAPRPILAGAGYQAGLQFRF